MKKRSIFLFILCSSFFSCRYDIYIEKDSKGKKHRIKEYKNYDVAQAKAEEKIFTSKHGYKVQSYVRYQNNLILDTTDGYSFIQYDSSRVYLWDTSQTLKTVFIEGLLSDYTIYCAIDSACRIFKERMAMKSVKGEPIVYKSRGWGGPEITISKFELLHDVHAKGHQRRFTLWLNFNGFYSTNVFFVEFDNDKADKNTNLNTFIKEARLTFIKSGWVTI